MCELVKDRPLCIVGTYCYAEYVHKTQLHTAQHFWCANRLLFVYVANYNPDSTTYTYPSNTTVQYIRKPSCISYEAIVSRCKKKNTQLYIFCLYNSERPEDALTLAETCRRSKGFFCTQCIVCWRNTDTRFVSPTTSVTNLFCSHKYAAQLRTSVCFHVAS
jgi:hypothetical protein